MTILKKMVAAAEKSAITKAWSAGLMRCPQCGQQPLQAPVDAETMMTCPACGCGALPCEWRLDPTAALVGEADAVPPGTRIQREVQASGDCVWMIPASGKFGFFLFFSMFWLAITATVSGGFLFASVQPGSEPMPWFLYLFFGIFWAVGLGTLVAALRNKYARHQIAVTRDLVTLRREMFGRVKEKSLITKDVTDVEQMVFYQQNYQPVYGVEIRGRGGKLRFGTALEAAEKAWLVADIRRAVFGAAAVAPTKGGITQVSFGGVMPRESSFAYPLPVGPKWQWVVGMVLVVAGVGALVMAGSGWTTVSHHGKEGVDTIAQVFDWVFNLFSVIPVLVGLVFIGVGGVWLSNTWQRRGQEVHLEADDSQVSLRVYQQGRIISEQSFPRNLVQRVASATNGQMNGRPMKRIDMIVDGKAVHLTRWTEGNAADEWVAAVNRSLGV